jgi:hypothetical protein
MATRRIPAPPQRCMSSFEHHCVGSDESVFGFPLIGAFGFVRLLFYLATFAACLSSRRQSTDGDDGQGRHLWGLSFLG